jgi:hypothetical protein
MPLAPYMSLAPFLTPGVFDLPAIDAMTEAFRACCWSFQLAKPNGPRTGIVARKVIEIAGMGERDAGRICGLVLLALSDDRRFM